MQWKNQSIKPKSIPQKMLIKQTEEMCADGEPVDSP